MGALMCWKHVEDFAAVLLLAGFYVSLMRAFFCGMRSVEYQYMLWSKYHILTAHTLIGSNTIKQVESLSLRIFKEHPR